MIDGAEHYDYKGLARHERGVLMAFSQGLLILDLDEPGWGAMRPSDHAALFPQPTTPRSARASDTEDSSDFDSSDSRSFGPLSTSSSRSSGSTHSSSSSDSGSLPPSPRPLQGAVAQPPTTKPWCPSPAILGWHPCESLVFAGPVTPQAVQAYKAVAGKHELQAFVAQLTQKNGPWALQPAGGAGTATMVAMQAFGELYVMVWLGTWHAAESDAHQHTGMTAAQACQIVAHSVVAPVCSLALVPLAELSEYQGHIVAADASILACDRGLLVLTHPDASQVGWHALGQHGHWGIVSPDDAGMLEKLFSSRAPTEHGVFQLFFDGSMDLPFGQGPFAAGVYSHRKGRWVLMRVDAPVHFQMPDDPHGPTSAAVQQALRAAAPALIHNRQSVGGPLGLSSGAWQVPLFLGAIRCIDAVVDAPGLLGTNWHDTLQPAIERCLLAHRKEESAWLSSGVIEQPIDHLIDLMRRDLALTRPEVRVMLPVELLADLFKTLAPHEKACVILAPKAPEIESALRHQTCTLLVFQAAGQPAQSIVLSQGREGWDGRTKLRPDELKARVTKAQAGGPGERLVALAYVV